MRILSLFLLVLLQTPAPPAMKVTVGLADGQQVVMENPEFSGFIRGTSADAVLVYRHHSVHGQMPLKTISRIEFGEYRKGEPFALILTLRDGQKLEVQSERQIYLTLRGKTDLGMVTINHPDPVGAPLRANLKKVDRKKDLTIQYLEFPAS